LGGDPATPGPFFELRTDRNIDAALALRGELSLGVRWPLLDPKDRTLAAYAGVTAIYEDWDSPAALYSRYRGVDGGEVELQLGLRYADGRFREELTVYPSLSELGDIRIRSNASYTMPFTPRLRLRLDLLVDYDNAPPFPGLSEWEAALGASLRVDF
jgi:hypothetical protein